MKAKYFYRIILTELCEQMLEFQTSHCGVHISHFIRGVNIFSTFSSKRIVNFKFYLIKDIEIHVLKS